MKYAFLFLVSVLLSGCAIYLEYPDEQIVSGKVYWKSGEVAANVNVTIWEGRSFITLLPISYPHAAKAVTNEAGYFEVAVKNSWPARITANVNCGYGASEINENETRTVVIILERVC